MRGWSCKEAAAALGISPTKTTQALYADRGAFWKVARLMSIDARRTLADLQLFMERIAAAENTGHPPRRVNSDAVTRGRGDPVDGIGSER